MGRDLLASINKVRIAIGPEMDRPTWSWVGFSLMRELSKYFSVSVFSPEEVPKADVILLIKERSPKFLELLAPSTKLIYFPCDSYEDELSIQVDPFLSRSSAIVCHSEKLRSIILKYHQYVFHIEHDAKFVLPVAPSYVGDGPVLWIGFSTYLPIVKEWLELHTFSERLVVLTDKPNLIDLPGSVSQLRWTPRRQFDLMRIAKGGFDIKGDSFNQTIRPPEKIQTFIASGIPAATNSSSTVAEYFRMRGFHLADPSDSNRWFSREYFEETRIFSEHVKESMRLTHIGSSLRNIILEVV